MLRLSTGTVLPFLGTHNRFFKFALIFEGFFFGILPVNNLLSNVKITFLLFYSLFQ